MAYGANNSSQLIIYLNQSNKENEAIIYERLSNDVELNS